MLVATQDVDNLARLYVRLAMVYNIQIDDQTENSSNSTQQELAKKAINYAEMALQLGKELNIPDIKFGATKALAKAYSITGNGQKSI